MKKLHILLTLISIAGTATAQDIYTIPDGGFQGTWEECVPWTSGNNTKAYGTQPAGWEIANVCGIGGLGATVVGKDTTGYESTQAVNLTNKANIFMETQIVPGYITLGTPWNTSVLGNKNDGGSWGGTAFTGLPDALTFVYQRGHGVCPADAKDDVKATYLPNEPFTVVAYTWKGSTSQADVPANIVMFGNPAKVTMDNRDRNILGIKTIYGGAISYYNDFKCVSMINDSIYGDTARWTRKTIPFTKPDKECVPEKINVIFSAGSYFNAKVGRDNWLNIDDVRLVYYSRLSSITVEGKEIPGFDPDVYDYSMEVDNIDDAAFDTEYTVMGNAAKANLSGNATLLIRVNNPQGADLDGESSHTYTIHFSQVSSVTDVAVDSASEAVYYNLLGQRVDNPVKGQLYLRHNGSHTAKVIY